MASRFEALRSLRQHHETPAIAQNDQDNNGYSARQGLHDHRTMKDRTFSHRQPDSRTEIPCLRSTLPRNMDQNRHKEILYRRSFVLYSRSQQLRRKLTRLHISYVLVRYLNRANRIHGRAVIGTIVWVVFTSGSVSTRRVVNIRPAMFAGKVAHSSWLFNTVQVTSSALRMHFLQVALPLKSLLRIHHLSSNISLPQKVIAASADQWTGP